MAEDTAPFEQAYSNLTNFIKDLSDPGRLADFVMTLTIKKRLARFKASKATSMEVLTSITNDFFAQTQNQKMLKIFKASSYNSPAGILKLMSEVNKYT